MDGMNRAASGGIPTTGNLSSTSVRAFINIDGLALLCFSEMNNRAEVGFLNIEDPQHPLLIWIDGIADPIEIPKGGTIVINSNHFGIGSQFRSAGDDRDFGLLIDLDAVHGMPVSVVNSDKFYARLFVNDATFFTAVKSTFPARLVEIGASSEKQMGQIGKVTGAYIYDGDVDLVIDGVPVDLSSISRPYRIEIKYQCLQGEPTPTPGSDYRFIYDVAGVPDGRRYDLIYDGNEPPYLSDSARARVAEILRKMQAVITSGSVEHLSQDERERLQAELEYAMLIVSCEVACQIVTIGLEPTELG